MEGKIYKDFVLILGGVIGFWGGFSYFFLRV